MSAPKSGGGRPTSYKLLDGKRVPGVTTIVGRFKESGGLIRWAYNCGRDGIDMDRTRDDAASAGTVAHAWIDDEIHGRPPTEFRDLDVEILEKAAHGVSAFRDWRASTKIEILETEVPLVSELHKFGGTLDAIGRVNGQLAMLDWKSSNKIYSDYLVQVSAYSGLWEECRREKIDVIHLLRVGKEFGDFHHSSWGPEVLARGWDAFLHMRSLYDIDAILKRAAA